MAYFFFDDGAPEAEDYANNYFYFNESMQGCIERLRKAARMRYAESFSPREGSDEVKPAHFPEGCLQSPCADS